MFWLVKLKFVWYTEFMDVYTKPSRFPAAVFPAMAMAPKEFTEDWISTLEMEKMAPCRPAGRPILAMFRSLSLWMASLWRSRRHMPSRPIRHFKTMPAEITWEITVAVATPATPILKMITKIRFRITFTTPEIKR